MHGVGEEKEKKIFSPSTRAAEVGGSEFEANLVYIASSRTARATQGKGPCLKKQSKQIPILNSKVSSELYSQAGKLNSERRILGEGEFRLKIL